MVVKKEAEACSGRQDSEAGCGDQTPASQSRTSDSKVKVEPMAPTPAPGQVQAESDGFAVRMIPL